MMMMKLKFYHLLKILLRQPPLVVIVPLFNSETNSTSQSSLFNSHYPTCNQKNPDRYLEYVNLSVEECITDYLNVCPL